MAETITTANIASLLNALQAMYERMGAENPHRAVILEAAETIIGLALQCRAVQSVVDASNPSSPETERTS